MWKGFLMFDTEHRDVQNSDKQVAFETEDWHVKRCI